MSRWEEIKTAALDVAQHVTQGPAQREAMAGDLITLIGLMVGAVGKCVAVEGEAELGRVRNWVRPTEETPEEAAEFDTEQTTESAKAHNRYLIGELLQTQADYVVREAKEADPPGDVCCDTPYGPDCKEDPFKVRRAVPRCPECLRAEGDGHAHGCRRVSTVAVHLSHDLDVDARGNSFHCDATPDGPTCNAPVGGVCGEDEPCPAHDDPDVDAGPVCGATPDGPACDWDMLCPVHGDTFGR